MTTVFSKKERRVRLQGEAYFAVAKDSEKPFIIDVNTLEVKVVGTAFKIDNLSQPSKVIVVVDEGIVEVHGRKDMKRLTKNEKAIFFVSGSRSVRNGLIHLTWTITASLPTPAAIDYCCN